MINLAEKVNEYLHDWYGALPIQALNKIHHLSSDYWSPILSEDYDEEFNNLKDEWYEFDLTDKLEIHDSLYEEFYEFTKGIVFNNLIN
jgi:hypothetical protein